MTREEFEHLVINVGPDIYSFCLQLARSRDEAEELYQDTMLTALEHQKNIDTHQNPKNYLIGVAIGLWKNLRRKIARRGRIHPECSLEEQLEDVYPADKRQSLEEEIVEMEQARMVQRMVAELPEKFRIPVYLYYSRELSVKEIADIMHIPQGTVKSRLYKARNIMKCRMEAENYEMESR